MFAGLGRWCFTNRRIVLLVWIVAFVGVTAAQVAVGAAFSDNAEAPDSESREGFDILDEHFGGVGSGLSGSIVFKAESGVADADVQDAMQEMFAEARAIEGVIDIADPYADPRGTAISPGGEVAFATVNLNKDVDQTTAVEIGQELRHIKPELDGLTVKIGGQSLEEFEPPESELIGLAFAIFVLILSFGSVLAMGLPIGVAVAGVGIGIGLTSLISNLIEMPDFATVLAAMIGLGVGIDYALFIVTRYREGLHEGMTSVDAATRALDTAGRAVIFAGVTVVISLMGMLLIGLPFITGLAIGAAVTVLITMIASVTLLPAVLGFAGDRIEVTRRRGLIVAALIAVALLAIGLSLPINIALGAVVAAVLVLVTGFLAVLALPRLIIGAIIVAALAAAALISGGVWLPAGIALGVLIAAVLIFVARYFGSNLNQKLPPRQVKPLNETLWYRWSRVVQRNPWVAAIAGTAILLLMASPLLGLRLGFSDESNYLPETDAKQAYDLLAEGFGAGFNGPLLVATELDGPSDLPAMMQIAAAISETPGVASATPPIPNNPDAPTAALMQVFPTTGPQAIETADLVDRLRTEVIPQARADSNDVSPKIAPEPKITGIVAVGIDFSDYLSGRTLVFFAAVLTLSFLLLMAVFRSLLVPVKAVIMNLLSIAAAYGIVVAIFQWGWGASLFGLGAGAPIEPFIPFMMFAIVFGLSMDYEVFLLSRIKEDYDHTGDAVNSVANGLAVTARVITAAAAIMVVVFGSFLLEDNRIIKLFGTGLALAVFLDATLVRMLLVPATMELLGERNWWLPKWLDKILPRINVEGPADELT